MDLSHHPVTFDAPAGLPSTAAAAQGSAKPPGAPGCNPLPSQETLRHRQQALAELGPESLARMDALAPGLQQRQTEVALRAVHEPRSNRSRLGVALQLVDEFGRAVEPLTACRRGCSHCCHIRVEMSELEAERLGAAIGRTPNKRLRYLPMEAGAGYGYDTPCPFLSDGECSIYEHRPFACRKHHSLDADDLFCRLDLPPEFAASAPRINPNFAVLVWGSAIGPSMGVADIRDFFPGPRELAQGPVGRIATMRELAEAADKDVE